MKKLTIALLKEWYNNASVAQVRQGSIKALVMHDATTHFFEYCFVPHWRCANKADVHVCTFKKSYSTTGFDVFASLKSLRPIHSPLYFSQRIEYSPVDCERQYQVQSLEHYKFRPVKWIRINKYGFAKGDCTDKYENFIISTCYCF